MHSHCVRIPLYPNESKRHDFFDLSIFKPMEFHHTNLPKNGDNISVFELRKLLQEIKDSRTDVCIRLRLLGRMWNSNFSKVFIVTAGGAVLIDQMTNATEIINNLSDIIQFELDSRYHNFQPFYHYSVDFNSGI